MRYLKNKKIPGDYVECGVWKGGNIMLLKKFLETEDEYHRNIYAYDTFEGMTNPDKNDFEIADNIFATKLLEKDKDKKTNVWGVCSLEEVKENISKHAKNLNNINFIKGPVENTLNEKKIFLKKLVF